MPCPGVTYTRTSAEPDVYQAPFRDPLPATPAAADQPAEERLR